MLFTQLVQICCAVSMCAAAWATLWATATVGNLKAHAGTRWWNQTDVVSLLTLDETVGSFSEPWGTSGPINMHLLLKSSAMFRYSLSSETILCEEQLYPLNRTKVKLQTCRTSAVSFWTWEKKKKKDEFWLPVNGWISSSICCHELTSQQDQATRLH